MPPLNECAMPHARTRRRTHAGYAAHTEAAGGPGVAPGGGRAAGGDPSSDRCVSGCFPVSGTFMSP
eukprot:358402-Chlamydomonas_euryale.AAC.3